MQGYWGVQEATEGAFIDRRWFRSGDVGIVDDQGVITIIDRLKDVYISGGENVYPAEVEKVLCDHGAVAEAAVIGVGDATWGEVGKAFVVLVAGGSATEDELIAHLRNRLAGYKIPQSLVLRDSLPRTASGKVSKSQLRTERT
jgi:fatty-acyl-CoA synthase